MQQEGYPEQEGQAPAPAERGTGALGDRHTEREIVVLGAQGREGGKGHGGRKQDTRGPGREVGRALPGEDSEPAVATCASE